jgi:hypothetical protein
MKQHPFDPWSFLFGLLFAAIGLVFLVPATPFVRPQMITNLFGIGGPVLLVLAGLALMAPLLRRKPQPVPPPPPMTDELPQSPLE